MDFAHVIVLLCCCLLTFGSYFSYDLPGSMPDNFRESLALNDTSKTGLFYSVYSLPNAIQPFFGGILIDRYLGLRRGAFLCCSLVFIGNTILAMSSLWAGTAKAYPIALLGRFIFGLGGETLSVTQNGFVAKWFRGPELTTAFAIVLSFARVGSAINFAVEPTIAQDLGFSAALFVSSGFCLLSIGACLLLMFMDTHYFEEPQAPLLATSNDDNSDVDEETQSHESPKKQLTIFESILAVIGKREMLIYLICLFFYPPVFNFLGVVAIKIIMHSYPGVDTKRAGLYCSLPYTVSGICGPFIGYVLDRAGGGLLFVAGACASLVIFHVSFAVIPGEINPTILMIWLGVTYSVCSSALWPLVSLVVESRNIATAYGLMMSIQNMGLALCPIILTGWLPNYNRIEFFFVALGITALLCSYVLFALDSDDDLSDSAHMDDLNSSIGINPLNPRVTPFLRESEAAFSTSNDVRAALAPKTPNAVRQAYFRRLRIQSHI